MRSSKPSGPSAEEVAAQNKAREEASQLNRMQMDAIKRQEADVAEARRRADADKMDADNVRRREEEARSGNRVGVRSLLSGDWMGFRRGGDLAGR
jgi:hypothetical protein